MPDYKQLCAEGVAFIRSATDPDDLSINAEKWVDKARAAMAEPEPEGPTDEDLESFLVDVAAEHGDIYWAEPLVLARAVLARWGK